eukprot:TRINITY_DN70737_c0_g1_i1.p2 TRINITY_DN70737_c0_g1~~TRINITY_DN70737_c0_g1_i1.p2  ORF type:complete len:152 (+),score=28.63 TRINITY_DN70737_c0_g1_i1:115-570(+)
MAFVQTPDFQHILRILNTNVEGPVKVKYAITSIQGIGRRFADIILKRAEIDLDKRAGELSADEIDRIIAIIENPRAFKIPRWFLNRRKDFTTGKDCQLKANTLATQLRNDLERLKKIRAHRGLRHHWGLRVRGQHSKSTGRRGKIVGVNRK